MRPVVAIDRTAERDAIASLAADLRPELTHLDPSIFAMPVHREVVAVLRHLYERGELARVVTTQNGHVRIRIAGFAPAAQTLGIVDVERAVVTCERALEHGVPRGAEVLDRLARLAAGRRRIYKLERELQALVEEHGVTA